MSNEMDVLSSDGRQPSDDEDELPLPLPTPTSTPLQHPDCCLGLSTTLVDTILHIFQAHTDTRPVANPRELTKPRLKCLSIGSGTGLFEALLTSRVTDHHTFELDLRGVEVASSTAANKYLPHRQRCAVQSTSSVYEEASDFDVWLFVYPRDPRLVWKYLDCALKHAENPELLLFLGPKSDFLPSVDTQDESHQETFADVLGSVSDHLDECQKFTAQNEEAGLQRLHLRSRCSPDSCKSKSSLLHASILSSPAVGFTSYEILCVLCRCHGQRDNTSGQ
ncbi:hypothetical protein PV08_04524 [Exophiala spinifera]|uniref:Methyltransferase domain-containing protein n=1 Tax=Exophiala spinifera TaxID=91928 RepID=A0A0D1ZXC1_9EURO|nr:uncharacterized protein PV08_04524 [Exophiala spinifera]KIW17332.1 hypothetical protein PV08_04524 [Exophiala spinifera]